MARQPTLRISEEEYLEQDRANQFKSEYIGGEMLATSGGTLRHAVIGLNCGSELRAKLAGTGCTVFSPDARIRTASTGSYLYADASVVCGEIAIEPNRSDILLNPTLVVEVLSPSTTNYDRGLKFDLYREITSLNEFLLVSTDSVKVTLYSRQHDNSWIFREWSGTESTVFIPALKVTLGLKDIYSNAMSIPA